MRKGFAKFVLLVNMPAVVRPLIEGVFGEDEKRGSPAGFAALG